MQIASVNSGDGSLDGRPQGYPEAGGPSHQARAIIVSLSARIALDKEAES